MTEDEWLVLALGTALVAMIDLLLMRRVGPLRVLEQVMRCGPARASACIGQAVSPARVAVAGEHDRADRRQVARIDCADCAVARRGGQDALEPDRLGRGEHVVM